MEPAGSASGRRLSTVLLIVLGLLFPVGALLQPWIWPARSHMPAVPRRLNAPVVLVTVSGLRADRLGHAGAARAVTPALDRLAEKGVSFEVCYAASNQELASAAALLTGTCPARTGVRGAGEVLPARHETLAERFAAAGYRTAAVVSNPALLGVGLEQGFASFDARPGAPADEIVEAGLQQIRAANDGPWLLWLDVSELLPPYGGAALDVTAFAPDAPAGFGASLDAYDLDEATLAARSWGPRELSWLSARYDAALARVDAAIGRLADDLSASNRLDMLTLCVTGLRGERLDERPPRFFTRGIDLTEDSVCVPLLLRLPAQTSRGLRLTRLAQGVDVAPTLADLSLHATLEGATGNSLRPAFQHRTRVNRIIVAEGLVLEAAGLSLLPAVTVRATSKPTDFKTVLLQDGRLFGAWRLPGAEGEQEKVPLSSRQLDEIERNWRETLGEAADCLDRVR